MSADTKTGLSPVEKIKTGSHFLRGTLHASLADGASGALAEDDTQLSKFHGIYQQDDRDVRDERRRRMLEPDHSFMIRARVPGGVCTPEQWLALDDIARRWANGSLRLTTRQAFQFHGVLKRDLKVGIREINRCLLDTIAACGDVNRNVMCTVLPEASGLHRQVFDIAVALSAHLTPHSRAYHEIWLDEEKVADTPESEPIYGPSYLPRKFKIAFAVPPRNDVDVLAHDLGFIAIAKAGVLDAFNITVAGGMGASHGDPATYPRLADVLGACRPNQALQVAESIVTIQRDFGDRNDRKHARFKYTVADRGLDWLRRELTQRLGWELQPARPFTFTQTGDSYGWQRTDDGLWHLGLFIESGRLSDSGPHGQLTGMREIAALHTGEFRLTPNQNVLISRVPARQREVIDALVRRHGLDGYRRFSPLRLHAMACVALPTCSLAMAEAERYLPDLVDQVETLLDRHGLAEQPITLRMTGCPNGCARPYLAEIGLVGKGPGRYNLHLGAAFDGTRLNAMVAENAAEPRILEILDELFAAYASRRQPHEPFGDFLVRAGHLPTGETSAS